MPHGLLQSESVSFLVRLNAESRHGNKFGIGDTDSVESQLDLMSHVERALPRSQLPFLKSSRTSWRLELIAQTSCFRQV